MVGDGAPIDVELQDNEALVIQPQPQLEDTFTVDGSEDGDNPVDEFQQLVYVHRSRKSKPEDQLEQDSEIAEQINELNQWLTDIREHTKEYHEEIFDVESVQREKDWINSYTEDFLERKVEIDTLGGKQVENKYQFQIESLMDLAMAVERELEERKSELDVLEDHYRFLPDDFTNTSREEEIQNDFKSRFLNDEEIEAIHKVSEGAEVNRKKVRILRLFKEFLVKCGEERPIKELPNAVLSRALGSFWFSHTKEDGTHPDTSTLKTDYSRLNAILKRVLGGWDPLSHPEFQIYRDLRSAKLRLAKEQPGNGQKRHQADLLHPEEVRYLHFIGVLNPSTGWGIIRMLYFNLCAVCNNRAVLDNHRMTLDSLQIVYDSDGRIEYAELRLQKQKRDQGEKDAPMKRPRIVPLEDKSRCFFTALLRYYKERRKLGPHWMDGDSPMFLEPRNTVDYAGSKNSCLFKPKALSLGKLSRIVINAAIEGDLNIQNRKICNSSVRIMSFKNQIQVGITPEQAQALDGHTSDKTRRQYDRGNTDNLDCFGGALGSAMSGSKAKLPIPAGVKAVQHLLGPETVKTKPVEMTNTVLGLEMSEKAITMTTGEAVPSVLPSFCSVFDNGKSNPSSDTLSSSYSEHLNKKFPLFCSRDNYGDEDDFNETFGGGLTDYTTDVPPLPSLEFDDPVVITRNEDAAGSSDQTRRAPSSTVLKEKNGRGRKRSSPSGPVSGLKKRKAPKVLKENDPVFARGAIAKMSWPGKVLKVFTQTDENEGLSIQYEVYLFGFKQTEILDRSKVDVFSNESYVRFGSPSFNKKRNAIREMFPRALEAAKHLAQSLGIEFMELKSAFEESEKEEVVVVEEDKEN